MSSALQQQIQVIKMEMDKEWKQILNHLEHHQPKRVEQAREAGRLENLLMEIEEKMYRYWSRREQEILAHLKKVQPSLTRIQRHVHARSQAKKEALAQMTEMPQDLPDEE